MKNKSKKSADKKPNTQTIRRKEYITKLQSMQEGSQPYTVLMHLIKRGHTTSLELATVFYIANPTAVISALRDKGCIISSQKIIPKDKAKKPWYKITLEV